MQVACDQCGATYEFESSAIPSEGYDAQCTHCNHVFFVAPAGGEKLIAVTCANCKTVYRFAASAIPAEGYDAQCTQCEAVFFVSAKPGGAPAAAKPTADKAAPPTPPASTPFPAATQTAVPRQVVAPAAASASARAAPTAPMAAPTPAAIAAPVATAAPKPTPSAKPEAEADLEFEPVLELEPEGGLDADPAPLTQPVAEPTSPPVADPVPLGAIARTTIPAPAPAAFPPSDLPVALDSAPDSSAADLDINIADLELGASAPEPRASAPPSPAAPAVPPPASAGLGDEDAGQVSPPVVALAETVPPAARQQRRRLLLIVASALALVGAGIGAVVAIKPTLLDAAIGRIGLSRSMPPGVEAGLARAHVFSLFDTSSAYDQALAELDKLHQIQSDNPDATALRGLIYVFRGLDARAGADLLREQERRARDELAALGTADEQSKQREDLHAVAADRESRAKALLEETAKELSQAFALLADALKAHPDSPALFLAAGFYYSTDSASSTKAEDMLTRSLELRPGSGTAVDLAHPPDALTAYLRALLWERQPENRERAREAFTAALKLEPNLQRARYDLALEYSRAGDLETAKRLLKEILTAVPDHTRASEALAAFNSTPVSVVTEAPAVVPPEDLSPKKGKKHKAKTTIPRRPR